MNIEAALVRAIAPSDLAEAVVGDLHELRTARTQALGDAKAAAARRSDVLRSLLSLLAYNFSRAFEENWFFALVAASVTCAACVATIPLWGHIGMGGAGYHLLRLALIGLVLGCIPRASTLSCAFLLLLIGISDCAMRAHDTYFLVLQDGTIMASVLVVLRLVRLVRISLSKAG
jgi:hypothetical protein